jgi:two-component system sensor histidine kinase BaeS
MFRTLRGWFVASHIIPLLFLVPLMGIVLVYVLETQVLLEALSSELMGQAVLIAELLSDRPEVWLDPAGAQIYVARLDPRLDVQVMLLSANGYLLASSDPADAEYVGQRPNLPGLVDALSGQVAVHKTSSRSQPDEIVDVLVPVVRSDRRIVGIVRLSYRSVSVQGRFLRLRSLTGGVLIGGLVLGAVVGWVLALRMERPLRRVTETVHRLITGEEIEPLSATGPREAQVLAQEVNALVERLRSLEQARRKLLANLVHELGRPLGALQSAIQALVGGADQDASLRRDLLIGMESEIGRLRRLLADLAGLHDQVVGTLELARQTIDLEEWVANILGPWRQAAHDKGLEWQVTVPETLPTAEIDPDRLGQALGNLLSNAIKYTPPGGAVSVEAGAEAEAAWVKVRDTGPGISPEERERIFTPLYRGQSDRRFPQGMGLGLSIARDLAAAHGGRIEVDSTPGHGSEFTLWIPLERA